MSLNTSSKIIKAKGAKPDEFEKRVSKALFDLVCPAP